VESAVVGCRRLSIPRPVDGPAANLDEFSAWRVGLFQGGVEQAVIGVEVPQTEVHQDVLCSVGLSVAVKRLEVYFIVKVD